MTARETAPVDDGLLVDATAKGIYRISLPVVRVAAVVIGGALRIVDRATDGMTCECGQPRRVHRHHRPGADGPDCERWTWAGWRATRARRSDAASCPHPDDALTDRRIPLGRTVVQTCGRCHTRWVTAP